MLTPETLQSAIMLCMKKHNRPKASGENHYLKQWRAVRGLTQEQLGAFVNMDKGSISRIERFETQFTEETLRALARALRIGPQDLLLPPPIGVISDQDTNQKMVEGLNHPALASSHGATRRGANIVPVTDQAPIIGQVQSGAWTEAYQYPEGDWEYVPMPPDARFPSVQQYLFRNVGRSMDRVCPDGGLWAVVMFRDLVGQGPTSGQYVIVERVRKDGLVEATAKLFKIGPDGKPWLHPDSMDPSFKPFPLEPDGPEIEEVRVIAKATSAIRPLP